MSSNPTVNDNNALMVPIYDKIPLSHLLEAAVQKTYHELYTMADVYVYIRFSIDSLNLLFFSYLVCIVNQTSNGTNSIFTKVHFHFSPK